MDARSLGRLAKGRSCAARQEIARWWEGLATDERRSLQGSARCRLRDDVIVGRFVEEPVSEEPEVSDFYEYLVNHEIYLEDARPFHICSAHPEARAVLRAGYVPPDFRCPRDEAGCPMRRILAEGEGRGLRLVRLRAQR
jgi:hypothetical protein